MTRSVACCVALLLLITAKGSRAQDSYNDRARKYIDQYATLAIMEQKRSGIPASITLGQGILETEAGASELMTQANNHFGIKCKNGWLGETFSHTDDAPDECFKKYKSAEESFYDHSEHLKRNQRYSPLFSISQTDYASWAVCLKKCGYATNPQYAQRLIKIIEDFKLQEYTYTAMDSSLLNNYAATHTLQIDDSEEVDDTDKKPVLARDTTILAGKTPDADTIKKQADTSATVITHKIHLVTEGETILKIAQMENIPMKTIRQFNMLNLNEEPLPGDTLQLEVMAAQKPAVRINSIAAHSGNAIVTGQDKNNGENDYIAIDRTKNNTHTDSPRVVKPAHTAWHRPVVVAPPPPLPSKLETIKKENAPKTVAPIPVESTNNQNEEDLASLKAELDKVVYADDSKLIAENAPPVIAPPQKKPVPEQPVVKSEKTYTVKKGDTAFSIAKRNNITVDQLMKWNNIQANDVKVGKTLRIKE